MTADLLAGIGCTAQVKARRQPGHVRGRLLPNHPLPPASDSFLLLNLTDTTGIAFLEAISTRTPHFSTKGATASQPRVEEVEGTCEGWWAGARTLWESVEKRARSERATQSGAHEFVRPFRARSLWMSFPGRCPGLAWVRPLASKRGVRVPGKDAEIAEVPGR